MIAALQNIGIGFALLLVVGIALAGFTFISTRYPWAAGFGFLFVFVIAASWFIGFLVTGR